MSRSPAEWLRVKELFHQALECAPEQRLAFLATASNGDTVLRVEVERLLTAHAQAGGFIEQSPVAPLATIPDGAADTKTGHRPLFVAGQIRGHYEILKLIGAGGMGEVYAARDIELGRTVALKVVIGDDVDAQKALRREAQHASQLNHPHICTIYEVGVWDGQAHIAMESARRASS